MVLAKKYLILIVIVILAIIIGTTVIVLSTNNSDVKNLNGDEKITGFEKLLKSLSFGVYDSDSEKTGFSLDGILRNKDLNIKDFEGYTIGSKLLKGNETILNNTITVSESYNGNEAMTLLYGDFDNDKKPDKAIVKVHNAAGSVVQTIEKEL